MLQISADLTVLSKFQREALADFILSFPNPGDDPIRACPKVEVAASLWPPGPAMLPDDGLTGDEGLTVGFEFPNASEDIWHPTGEQLKGVNSTLSLIDGEAIHEQVEAAFRSVM